MASEVLVEVTRGGLVESIHRGDVAVVNAKGELLYSVGDAYKKTYVRSCCKPFQTVNLVRSGASGRLGLEGPELAICCASHYGEKHHLATIESMLKKIDATHDHFKGGIATSLDPDYALQLAREQVVLTPLHSDCSGKHAGMLAVCRDQGYPMETYLEEDHPLQKAILKDIAEFCKIKEEDIVVGKDGCSAPVHAMPLYNMALGYARFADPEGMEKGYKEAAGTLFEAMVENPEMLSGTGGFCTELTKASQGALFGKIGAEGVYGVALRGHGIGIAMKMEAGNMSMLSPAVCEVLAQLGVLTPHMAQTLKNYHNIPNVNDLGTVVGVTRPAFKLTKRQ